MKTQALRDYLDSLLRTDEIQDYFHCLSQDMEDCNLLCIENDRDNDGNSKSTAVVNANVTSISLWLFALLSLAL